MRQLIEGDETVTLTLQDRAAYTLGDDRRHTLTIRDDDLPRASFAAAASNPGEGKGIHKVRVNLDPPAPPGGLTLRYNVSGDATRNRDYSVANTEPAPEGASSVDIWVDITDDGDNEADETVVLTLRPGSDYAVDAPGEHTVTIGDDDPVVVNFESAEAGVSETRPSHQAYLTLEPPPHQEITITYGADPNGTTADAEDYSAPGTVTVPRGRARYAVPIAITYDDFAEGDEKVVLTLNPPGADAGYTLGSRTRYELTILDDDAPEVFFTAASARLGEGDGTHVVTVSLDAPVAVGFSVSGPPNTGAGGNDYSGIPAAMQVTIPPGLLEADIAVAITPDGDNEADEVLVLTLEDGVGYFPVAEPAHGVHADHRGRRQQREHPGGHSRPSRTSLPVG